MVKRLSRLTPLAMIGLFYNLPAHAGLTPVSCGDPTASPAVPYAVTLDKIENNVGADPFSAGAGLGAGPTSCYEAAWNDSDKKPKHNDDQGGLSSPDPNIGQVDDGWLNGEGDWIDPLELIDATDLVDVDGVNGANDPGWIHLANIQIQGDTTPVLSAGSTGGEGKYSWVHGLTGVSMSVSDLLTIGFTCSGTGKDKCSMGTWSIDTKNDILDSLDKLGLGNSSFDHLLFSFKAANDVFIYDFDFNILDDALDPNVFDYETPYDFSGTWNSRDFNYKNLSHVNVWVRDPLLQTTTQVPAPAPLALLGLGLLAMGVARAARRIA